MEILLQGSTHVKMQEMLHKPEGVVCYVSPAGGYLPAISYIAALFGIP